MQVKAFGSVCLVYVFCAQYTLTIIAARGIFPKLTLKGVQEIGCLFQ